MVVEDMTMPVDTARSDKDVTNLITHMVMGVLDLGIPDDQYGNRCMMDACLRLASGAAEQLAGMTESAFLLYARTIYEEITSQYNPRVIPSSS